MNLLTIGLACISGILMTLAGIWVSDSLHPIDLTPVGEGSVTYDRTLDKYSIESLATRSAQAGPITLEKQIKTTDTYTQHIFSFTTDGKKVYGLANIPVGNQTKYPVIVQYRGYVDREIYESGIGTQRSGEVYAANGFITLAPDFLGYGESDPASKDALEERFQTYTTALDMLAAVSSLKQADASRLGIWGHSNGGHIALTVLTITGKPYPTTLWAPVSKPFPYSILYYTDELPDEGKFLRGELSRFEGFYDVQKYTFRTYLDRISAPMLLHQGTADDAVPFGWSKQLADLLKEKGKDITFYSYSGADHNMLGSWNDVVEHDIEFFKNELL